MVVFLIQFTHMASMTNLEHDETPSTREVAFYLCDLVAQLSAMARGGGLHDVAQALMRAHELCLEATDRDSN
jgi:hypothetical protein